jgi:predicted GNAT superfamily acetyltransferase
MPTPGSSPRLRPVTETDTDAVLTLNEMEVANLAPMDAARLSQLRGLADRFDVIEVDGRFAGFVITFAPGAAYDSDNYAWFQERLGEQFYYLDRVVLDPSVRRRGVGGWLYDEMEGVASAYGRMALEVNLIPENGPSLAFHRPVATSRWAGWATRCISSRCSQRSWRAGADHEGGWAAGNRPRLRCVREA